MSSSLNIARMNKYKNLSGNVLDIKRSDCVNESASNEVLLKIKKEAEDDSTEISNIDSRHSIRQSKSWNELVDKSDQPVHSSASDVKVDYDALIKQYDHRMKKVASQTKSFGMDHATERTFTFSKPDHQLSSIHSLSSPTRFSWSAKRIKTEGQVEKQLMIRKLYEESQKYPSFSSKWKGADFKCSTKMSKQLKSELDCAALRKEPVIKLEQASCGDRLGALEVYVAKMDEQLIRSVFVSEALDSYILSCQNLESKPVSSLFGDEILDTSTVQQVNPEKDFDDEPQTDIIDGFVIKSYKSMESLRKNCEVKIFNRTTGKDGAIGRKRKRGRKSLVKSDQSINANVDRLNKIIHHYFVKAIDSGKCLKLTSAELERLGWSFSASLPPTPISSSRSFTTRRGIGSMGDEEKQPCKGKVYGRRNDGRWASHASVKYIQKKLVPRHSISSSDVYQDLSADHSVGDIKTVYSRSQTRLRSESSPTFESREGVGFQDKTCVISPELAEYAVSALQYPCFSTKQKDDSLCQSPSTPMSSRHRTWLQPPVTPNSQRVRLLSEPDLPLPDFQSDVECSKDCCRLGCVCESLQSPQPYSQRRDHCGKYQCMFLCSCSKFERIAAQKPGAVAKLDFNDSMTHSAENIGLERRSRKRRRSAAKVDEEGMPKKKRRTSSHLQQDISFESLGSSMTDAEGLSVRKSQRIKGKGSFRNFDSLKSLIYYDASVWLRDDSTRSKRKKSCDDEMRVTLRASESRHTERKVDPVPSVSDSGGERTTVETNNVQSVCKDGSSCLEGVEGVDDADDSSLDSVTTRGVKERCYSPLCSRTSIYNVGKRYLTAGCNNISKTYISTSVTVSVVSSSEPTLQAQIPSSSNSSTMNDNSQEESSNDISNNITSIEAAGSSDVLASLSSPTATTNSYQGIFSFSGYNSSSQNKLSVSQPDCTSVSSVSDICDDRAKKGSLQRMLVQQRGSVKGSEKESSSQHLLEISADGPWSSAEDKILRQITKYVSRSPDYPASCDFNIMGFIVSILPKRGNPTRVPSQFLHDETEPNYLQAVAVRITSPASNLCEQKKTSNESADVIIVKESGSDKSVIAKQSASRKLQEALALAAAAGRVAKRSTEMAQSGSCGISRSVVPSSHGLSLTKLDGCATVRITGGTIRSLDSGKASALQSSNVAVSPTVHFSTSSSCTTAPNVRNQFQSICSSGQSSILSEASFVSSAPTKSNLGVNQIRVRPVRRIILPWQTSSTEGGMCIEVVPSHDKTHVNSTDALVCQPDSVFPSAASSSSQTVPQSDFLSASMVSTDTSCITVSDGTSSFLRPTSSISEDVKDTSLCKSGVADESLVSKCEETCENETTKQHLPCSNMSVELSHSIPLSRVESIQTSKGFDCSDKVMDFAISKKSDTMLDSIVASVSTATNLTSKSFTKDMIVQSDKLVSLDSEAENSSIEQKTMILSEVTSSASIRLNDLVSLVSQSNRNVTDSAASNNLMHENIPAVSVAPNSISGLAEGIQGVSVNHVVPASSLVLKSSVLQGQDGPRQIVLIKGSKAAAKFMQSGIYVRNSTGGVATCTLVKPSGKIICKSRSMNESSASASSNTGSSRAVLTPTSIDLQTMSPAAVAHASCTEAASVLKARLESPTIFTALLRNNCMVRSAAPSSSSVHIQVNPSVTVDSTAGTAVYTNSSSDCVSTGATTCVTDAGSFVGCLSATGSPHAAAAVHLTAASPKSAAAATGSDRTAASPESTAATAPPVTATSDSATVAASHEPAAHVTAATVSHGAAASSDSNPATAVLGTAATASHGQAAFSDSITATAAHVTAATVSPGTFAFSETAAATAELTASPGCAAKKVSEYENEMQVIDIIDSDEDYDSLRSSTVENGSCKTDRSEEDDVDIESIPEEESQYVQVQSSSVELVGADSAAGGRKRRKQIHKTYDEPVNIVTCLQLPNERSSSVHAGDISEVLKLTSHTITERQRRSEHAKHFKRLYRAISYAQCDSVIRKPCKKDILRCAASTVKKLKSRYEALCQELVLESQLRANLEKHLKHDPELSVSDMLEESKCSVKSVSITSEVSPIHTVTVGSTKVRVVGLKPGMVPARKSFARDSHSDSQLRREESVVEVKIKVESDETR